MSAAKLLEKAKSLAFSTATRLGMEDGLYAAARLIPKQERASLKESSFAVDRRESRAYVSPLGGSSGCGGIILSSRDDRGPLRRELIRAVSEGLLSVVDPRDGRRVVRWVKPREAIVRGRCAGAAPDLLYQLEPGYGVSRSIFGSMFTPSPTHRRVSGGHTSEGVLAMRGRPGLPEPRQLEEVYHVVMEAIGKG